MSTQAVFYFSMVLFLISLLGVMVSADAISSFIARQLASAGAFINLLNLSLDTLPGDTGTTVMLTAGFLIFYLLEFTILFYFYSNKESVKDDEARGYQGLFSLEKQDWWGEDDL